MPERAPSPGMMRARGLLAFLLVAPAVLAVAPFVAADGGFDAGAFLGDRSLHVEVVGAPILAAGVPLELRARTDAEGLLEMRLVRDGMEATDGWFPLRAEGGTSVAPLVFPTEGAWRIEVRSERGDIARFDVDVWPEAGAFVEPVGDAATLGVMVEGTDAVVAMQLTDASGTPLPPPADALAHVVGPEGRIWTEPLVVQDGALALARPFTQPGEYEVRVGSESLGLHASARPPIGLLVVPPAEADVYGLGEARETPGAGWLIVPGVALAALLTRGRPWRRSCSR